MFEKIRRWLAGLFGWREISDEQFSGFAEILLTEARGFKISKVVLGEENEEVECEDGDGIDIVGGLGLMSLMNPSAWLPDFSKSFYRVRKRGGMFLLELKKQGCPVYFSGESCGIVSEVKLCPDTKVRLAMSGFLTYEPDLADAEIKLFFSCAGQGKEERDA